MKKRASARFFFARNLRAACRCASPMDTLRLLDLDIDRPAQRVSRAGQVLPVSGLSWTLLDVMLAHGAEVVDFDTLAAQQHAADLLELIAGDGLLQRQQACRICRRGASGEGRGTRGAEQGENGQDRTHRRAPSKGSPIEPAPHLKCWKAA